MAGDIEAAPSATTAIVTAAVVFMPREFAAIPRSPARLAMIDGRNCGFAAPEPAHLAVDQQIKAGSGTTATWSAVGPSGGHGRRSAGLPQGLHFSRKLRVVATGRAGLGLAARRCHHTGNIFRRM